MIGAKENPDHEQHRVGRGPQRGQCQKGHDDGGQRQERIDQPAEHLIEPAAEIAHGQTQRRAEDGAENGGQRSHGQDVARAHDDAGKDVAAQLVGAEPMRIRGRRERLHDIGGEGVIGHRQRPEQRAEDAEGHDQRPDQKGRHRHQPPQRAGRHPGPGHVGRRGRSCL